MGKKTGGFIPPKQPVKPASNTGTRGVVPPKPPVKPPKKTTDK